MANKHNLDLPDSPPELEPGGGLSGFWIIVIGIACWGLLGGAIALQIWLG
ncbi:MAG: hypothetical protein AAGF24_14120 [Cyanobacteria bacterium P01_H01_bin.121]